MNHIVYFPLVVGVFALSYSCLVSRWLKKKSRGTAQMQVVADAISMGSRAFLSTVYKIISLFVLFSTLPIAYLGFYTSAIIPSMALTYVLGALCSALAGYIGIVVATCTNVRTAQAARSSVWQAFRLAFSGGSVMGMSVVGCVLLGVGSIFFTSFYMEGESVQTLELVVQRILGFALGSQVYALFMRVAGGIYTKSADIGADMVGKLEASLPEDDMRNPAVIADNVGDNVGDNAGSGADMFSSLTAVMVGGIGIGVYFGQDIWQYILLLPSLVTVCYLVKILLSHVLFTVYKLGESKRNPNVSGMLVLSLAFPAFFLNVFLAGGWLYRFCATSIMVSREFNMLIGAGIMAGIMVGLLTMHFTQEETRPVGFIIKQSTAGAGNNVIAGLSVGMFSAVAMSVFLVGMIGVSYHIGELAGVAVFGISILSSAVMYLTIDAFGPIADNAGGIVEMAGLDDGGVARRHTDVLDVAGNTTAASGKGFSMVSAALSSILLFALYTHMLDGTVLSLSDVDVLLGILLGASVPYLFSAMTMRAVGRASLAMVDEVRRQFRDMPGLLKGDSLPDYARCITIATHAALRQVWVPGLLVIGVPIVIGMVAGGKILGAYVIGVMLSGILLGIFQCNAGGAWDNAKKAFERGVKVEGEVFTKESAAYHAAVVGDTVGDPFKDTSGPSMNILIKLTVIIALLMAPYLS